MLILLVLPVIVAVATFHRYLHVYAPSNSLSRWARAQQPRWRSACALAAVAGVLVIAMHAVAGAAVSGAPDWLNLVVLVLAWDAIKISMLTATVIARCAVRAVRACSVTLSTRHE